MVESIYFLGICLKKLRKTATNLSQDSLCHCWDSNLALSWCKSRVLPLRKLARPDVFFVVFHFTASQTWTDLSFMSWQLPRAFNLIFSKCFIYWECWCSGSAVDFCLGGILFESRPGYPDWRFSCYSSVPLANARIVPRCVLNILYDTDRITDIASNISSTYCCLCINYRGKVFT